MYLKSPVRDPVDCGEFAYPEHNRRAEATRPGEGASRNGIG